MRIGDPGNPMLSLRLRSMYLLYVSGKSFGSLMKNTKVGGLVDACVT